MVGHSMTLWGTVRWSYDCASVEEFFWENVASVLRVAVPDDFELGVFVPWSLPMVSGVDAVL